MFEIYKDLVTLLGENNQNEIIRKLNLFCNAIYGFFVIYESLRKVINVVSELDYNSETITKRRFICWTSELYVINLNLIKIYYKFLLNKQN